MKISHLHLEHFRCFANLDIDFHTGDEAHGGLTVLVARNGEGKTAVLDGIDVAIGPFIGKMPKTRGAGFTPDDIEKRQNKLTGALKMSADFVENAVGRPDLFHDTPQFSIKRELTSSKKKPTTTIKDAKPLITLAEYLFKHEDEAVLWPLLAYYGDSRLWAAGRVTVEKKEALLKRERAYGYLLATEPQAGYREFEQWYADLSNAIWVSERQRQNKSPLFKEADLIWYRQLSAIIDKALKQALEITGWTKLEFDGDKQIMAINEQTGDVVPWTSLSAGNRIVIGLVADIAHRCCILNSWAKEKALEVTPGIVLIDEIELHLHPAWQQHILPTLQRIFPKIQFIVTTHSPQVISSVPKECVRIIDGGQIIPFSTPTQGVEVGDILSGIFGTDPIPQNSEIAQKLNQLHAMLAEGKGDSAEWEFLYQELEKYYGKDYPPLLGTKAHRDFLKKMKSR